jgi:hypothetical protein
MAKTKTVIPEAKIIAKTAGGRSFHARVCPACQKEIREAFTQRNVPAGSDHPQDRATKVIEATVGDEAYRRHFQREHGE